MDDALLLPGDIITVPEADYMYGTGELKLRVLRPVIVPAQARPEWVYVLGRNAVDRYVPALGKTMPGVRREAIVRRAALERPDAVDRTYRGAPDPWAGVSDAATLTGLTGRCVPAPAPPRRRRS